MKNKITIIVICLTCLYTQNISAQNIGNSKQYKTAWYTLLDNGTVSLDSFIVQPAGQYVIPHSITIDGQRHIVSLLEQHSFLKSTELTTVIIPSGVDSIENGLFGNCLNLTEILVDAENKKFKSEDGILYSKDGTKLYSSPVKKSRNQKERFVINENVKEIASFAFVNNAYKQIVLSKVEKIGRYAFFLCTGLENIVIPASVSFIGEYAFSRCENLEYVSFQEGSRIESVRAYTFAGCYKLNRFDNLPQHIRFIGDYAFENCYALNAFSVPAGVTLIGEKAFRNCQGLKTITLPETLKGIGTRAFYNCLHLSSVTVPNSVTKIGEGAFIYCPELESVKMPDKLDSIKPFTFAWCKKLKSVDLPFTLRSIGDYAFRESGIENLVIPANVTSYGRHFVKDCKNLTSVTFLNDSQILPDSLFYNLKKLKNVKLSDNLNLIGASAFELSGITQIEIPQDVMLINNKAFASCSDLRSVKLNQNLLMIRKGAFYSCGKMEDIELPKNLLSLEEEAFYNCDSLKSVTIPYYITKIERGTFYGCGALAEINFNASIDSIMPYAFEGCQYNLEKLILPENLKYMGEEAFAYCYSLKYVSIPQSLTRIPAKAFKENYGLDYISIPATVTEIGESALECTSAFLFDVYMHSYEPPAIYDDHVFYNDYFPRRVIYIPKGSKTAYKADPIWKKLNLKEMDESEMPE